MISPQWLRSDAPLLLACLEKRGIDRNLLDEAVQLHDDLRSLNHELSEANAAQKEARKAKDEAKVKEIRSTVAQLKERISIAEPRFDAALRALPNLVHFSVPSSEDEIMPLSLDAESQMHRADLAWPNYLKACGLPLASRPMIAGTFQNKEFPLYYYSANELISLVGPPDGWQEFDRHFQLVSNFLGDEPGTRAVYVCAEKMDSSAAQEIHVFRDDKLFAVIRNCTDYVPRGLKLKLAKATSLSKSIHDNGLCWLVKTTLNPS